MAGTEAIATRSTLNDHILHNEPTKWQSDSKTSSFAIAMIALFFIGTGLLGYGLCTLPSVVMTGFGFMYQIAALHFVVIGLVCFVIASVLKLLSYQRCEQKAPAAPNGP